MDVACVGVITGSAVEAGCLPRTAAARFEPRRVLVFCSGADPLRAEAGAVELINNGATALVSFGLAAGLAPIIRPGEVLVAESVVTPDGEKVYTDDGWRRSLLSYLGGPGNGCRSVRLAGSDHLLGSDREKRRLFRATGAGAVDMESHAVAAVAREMGVPFLAVRAVADPVERSLPSAAFSALRSNGATNYLGLARHLVIRPWELPAFMQLVQDSRLGLAALRRVAAAGSPLLAAP
ncbi:MAG TPA: hypothetical protein VFG47_08345 [Geminicoccaceae bacterium]|nr:hypothetical protein [Geminicoccaceae bacterium]